MSRHAVSQADWIAHVFDRPVIEPVWYWDIDNKPPEIEPEQALSYISETFERAPELLYSYIDAQLNQGFWYVIGCNSPWAFDLGRLSVPWFVRQRALRSFVPLFRDFMAARCTPQLSHCEQPDCPLNIACYMWWDMATLSSRGARAWESCKSSTVPQAQSPRSGPLPPESTKSHLCFVQVIVYF